MQIPAKNFPAILCEIPPGIHPEISLGMLPVIPSRILSENRPENLSGVAPEISQDICHEIPHEILSEISQIHPR